MTQSTPCEYSTTFVHMFFRDLEPDLTEEQQKHLAVCDYCKNAREEGKRTHRLTEKYRNAHPEYATPQRV